MDSKPSAEPQCQTWVICPLEIIHGTYKVDKSKKIHYKISLDNVVKKHNVKPPKIQNMIRCILF